MVIFKYHDSKNQVGRLMSEMKDPYIPKNCGWQGSGNDQVTVKSPTKQPDEQMTKYWVGACRAEKKPDKLKNTRKA